jgi:hypothetical protein
MEFMSGTNAWIGKAALHGLHGWLPCRDLKTEL